MSYTFVNNASTTLLEGVPTRTSFTGEYLYVPAGDGTKFIPPTRTADGVDPGTGRPMWQAYPEGNPPNGWNTYVNLTLSTSSAYEVVKLNSVILGATVSLSGTPTVVDILEVYRDGLEGTWQAWAAGASIEARLTAAQLNSLPFSNTVKGLGTALGDNAVAVHPSSAAFGYGARAEGESSTAVSWGARAQGPFALALGGYVPVAHGVSIGADARVSRADTLGICALPTIQRDNWWMGYGAKYYSAIEPVICLNFADFGSTPVWQSSTTYTDGDVVKATAGGDMQFVLWHGLYNANALPNTMTSAPAEPTWPTAVGGDVAAEANEDHWWIAQNPTTGVIEPLPAGTVLYITEVGFFCFKYANVTAAPFISVGSSASPTAVINNQQLTGITGVNQRAKLTPTANVGITGDLQIRVDTKAAGANSQFFGRPYVRGFVVSSQG